MTRIALLVAVLLIGVAPAHRSRAASPAAELVEEGNRLYVQGDLEGALKKYLEAQTELEEEAPEVHFNIGDVQFGKGKFEEAEAEFRRAGQGGRQELLPHVAYNLATAAAKQEDVDRAIELYKTAIRLDPKDLESRHNLGVLLQKKEQKQKDDQKKQDEQKDQKDQQDQKDQEKDQKKDQKQDQQQDQKDEGEQDRQNDRQQEQGGQDEQKDRQKDEQEQGEESRQPRPEEGEEGKQEQASQGGETDGEKEPIKMAIPREQAERLLDLLKGEERTSLLLGARQKADPETDPTKDW